MRIIWIIISAKFTKQTGPVWNAANPKELILN